MADLNRTFLLISRHSQLLLTVNGDAIPAAVYNRRTQKPQCLEKRCARLFSWRAFLQRLAGASRRSLRPRSKSMEDFTKNFAVASFATAERPHGRR